MKSTILLLGAIIGFSLLGFNMDVNPKALDQQRAFHSIVLKGHYEVYLTQGTSSKVEVKGDTERLETWVEDGVLYVEGSSKIWKGGDAVLYIQVAEFRSLSSSGAIELQSEGVITGDDVELELAGASEVSLALEVRKLWLQTAGASEVELSGNALYADFISAGASEINAMSFKVRSLGIETAGASELDVYVTDEMKVKARGASEIRYRGNPEHIIRDLKGATSLESI
jgi:hypothetical protein